METFVLVLGGLNLLSGLYSLLTSLGYRKYIEGASEPPPRDTTPSVTLFVPCCGAEEGLSENLEALLTQDYPGIHVRFVVEAESDTAVPVIRDALERHRERADLVTARPATARGQKVENLLVALDDAPETDVLAFADSDVRPDRGWMRRLVAALEEDDVGVASSYRFYVPKPATFANLLRSVWNVSVLGLLGDHDHNFAWGGAMALRREVFERIGVVDAWRGALSDDYALTHAVRRAGSRVAFVPNALVASYGSVGLGELFSWVARQITITRVYWPSLYGLALANHVVHTSFLVLAAGAAVAGSPAAALLLAGVLLLGFSSGALRALALRRWRPLVKRHLWAYVLMVPLASFLTLFGTLRALASRRIEWRGRVYEMRSPTETIILRG